MASNAAHSRPVSGGLPNNSVDVPICAVFLVLFLGSAAGHMTIYKKNGARGHKFLFNIFFFGFSMARIASLVLRIAWANYQSNHGLSIAAPIFVAAAVLILYVANFVFVQRIVRALHPRIGWSKAFSWTPFGLYGIVFVCFVMNITTLVIGMSTTNPSTLHTIKNIQYFTMSYLALFACLPLLILLVSFAIPRKERLDKFGEGTWRAKLILIFTTSALLGFSCAIKNGTALKGATSLQTPWYFTRPFFYVMNFGVEITVSYIFLFARVDKRFYVPNGAKSPYDYSRITGSEKGEGSIEMPLKASEERVSA